jgi:ribosomal protein L18
MSEQSTDLWTEQAALRVGLEIGLRSADAAWRQAIAYSPHISLVPEAAGRRVAALLRELRPLDRTPVHKPWP